MINPVTLSEQALKRLPRYLWYLKELQRKNIETVSAPSAANYLGLNEVQVRKEFSAMSSAPGKPRTGFQVDELIQNIECYLGFHNVDDAVLVGTGSLGNALLGSRRFDECGVHIVAAFDRNSALNGATIHGKPVFDAKKITSLCSRMKIHIGIITVPAEQAQLVCDQLLAGGVMAIWNFAPVELRTPKNVLVKNEDLAASLVILSKKLQAQLREQKESHESPAGKDTEHEHFAI